MHLPAVVVKIAVYMQNAVGIPAGIQRLIFGGRQLLDELSLRDSSVEADATLHLVLRLRGGKGGFGALLRGAGRAAQSDNQDAMRDLSGRRLRHVNADKKLQVPESVHRHLAVLLWCCGRRSQRCKCQSRVSFWRSGSLSGI